MEKKVSKWGNKVGYYQQKDGNLWTQQALCNYEIFPLVW